MELAATRMIGWGKWEVHIRRPMDRLGGELTIFRASLSERKYQVMHFDNKGEGVAETIEAGMDVPATMRFGDETELRGVLSAFVETAQQMGVKTPDESHNAGKLVATEKHLEDMRKLVFEDKVEVRGVPESVFLGKGMSFWKDIGMYGVALSAIGGDADAMGKCVDELKRL